VCTATGFEQILLRHVARLQPLTVVVERRPPGVSCAVCKKRVPLLGGLLRLCLAASSAFVLQLSPTLCRKSPTMHPASTCDAPEHGSILTRTRAQGWKGLWICVPAVGEHVDGTRVAVEAAHALARRPSRDDIHLPAQRHARLGAPLPHKRRQLRVECGLI